MKNKNNQLWNRLELINKQLRGILIEHRLMSFPRKKRWLIRLRIKLVGLYSQEKADELLWKLSFKRILKKVRKENKFARNGVELIDNETQKGLNDYQIRTGGCYIDPKRPIINNGNWTE